MLPLWFMCLYLCHIYIIMATLLKPNGMQEQLKPASATFSTKELQRAVGGFFEMINLTDGQVMIMNENGHFDPALQLAENKKATKIYMKHFYRDLNNAPMSMPLVGNVLICDKSEITACVDLATSIS